MLMLLPTETSLTID